MRSAARKLPDAPQAPSRDNVVHLHGTWQAYLHMLKARGESSCPRLTYADGVLEFMSPSEDHERISRALCSLVMVYCVERDIDCRATGSWTLKNDAKQVGAEADETFTFGPRRKPVYDLAVEVVRSTKAGDKLPIYAALGIREVWIWQDNAITVHTLRGNAYRKAARSKVLPGIDIALLLAQLDEPITSRMTKRYRRALRSTSRS